MKKKLILLVVVLLLLVGCKQDKFYLDSEHYGKAAITDIDSNRLKEIELNNSERIECDTLILAIGHSARDTFRMLYNFGLNYY